MFREGLRPPDPFRQPDPWRDLCTQDDMSVEALASYGPMLVFLLPTLGTAPAADMLADVARHRKAIEAGGTRIVLVHTAAERDARDELARFDLAYVARVADPLATLYDHVGLGHASALAASWQSARGLLRKLAPGRQQPTAPAGDRTRLFAVVDWRDSACRLWRAAKLTDRYTFAS